MTEGSGLIRGLEGVVAAETQLCDLDGANGRLAYRGYDIADLAQQSTFEQVTYLLLHGDLPKPAQLDGFVVALTLTKGEVVWVRSIAADAKQFIDVDTTPVVDRGSLYVASASGGLYALDPADGTERWRMPILSVGGLTVEGDRLYVAAADEGLHCLDRGGHILWRQGMYRAGDPSPPVIHGEYLILTTSEKGLFVVDKRSGELYESWNPGVGVAADPTVAGDKLYVLSNGGILYAMLLREF